MSTPLIQIEHVNKSFGAHHVLKDVSTAFHAGQVAVIVGASGSGKSTLLRTLNRLERHDSGRITVDGIEVDDHPRHLEALRREVGMVFQQFNLFSHLSVLDNVTLAPGARARSAARRPTTRRWSCCAASAWRPTRTSIRSPCRAGSSSAWPSPARWPCNRA